MDGERDDGGVVCLSDRHATLPCPWMGVGPRGDDNI